jgi:aminopeptidase YwaD
MRPTSLAVLCVSLALMAVAIGAIVVRAMSGEPAPEAAAPIVPTAPADARPTDGPAITPAATPGTSGPTGSASGPAEHDGSRALSILQELAKGPRVSGSPAEARAAEYISGLLRSYGYTTEVMSFEFEGDRFRAGEVRLDGQPSEALTLAGSPGGEVQASAVHVGLADAAGVSGKDLKGKVAVADRGTLNFFDKYTNARDAGAVGLILVNNRPGPFSGNLTTLASFPVVSVSQEDGAAIVDAARAGRTVAISAPPTTGLTVALNVIARPTTASECKVLVGGHFDSVPGAPGANDNASGVANVIELARAAAVDGLDEGVCFAAFGAEESGLYGSKALVSRWQKEGKLPRYAINLDVTGIGESVEVIGDGQIARAAVAKGVSLGIPTVPSQLPANSGSDHQSFIDAGVPTVFFTSGDFSTIHSPLDVSGDISVTMLDQVGDVAFAVLNDLVAQVAQG